MNKVNKLVTVILTATVSLFSGVSEARGGIHWGIYLGGNTSERYYAPPPESYNNYRNNRGYYPPQRPYYDENGAHYNRYMGKCKYAYGPAGYHPCPRQ